MKKARKAATRLTRNQHSMPQEGGTLGEFTKRSMSGVRHIAAPKEQMVTLRDAVKIALETSETTAFLLRALLRGPALKAPRARAA